MECARIQDELLEAMIEPRPASTQAFIAEHLRTCADCAHFAAIQQGIDDGLTAALRAPAMRPQLRALVRDRIRHEPVPTTWPDFLPDIVHLVGCGVVTLVSLAILPFNPAIVIGVGLVGTTLSHAALNAARSVLEEA
jgi:hypothetical protein